jgi:hypothetical protein
MPDARWRDVRGLSVGGKYWGRGWTQRWLREAERRSLIRQALGERALADQEELKNQIPVLTRRLDETITLLELDSAGDDTKRVHSLAARVNDHLNYLGWLRRQDDAPLEFACAERLIVHDLLRMLRLARWWLGTGGMPAPD